MKKLFALILMFLLVLSLTACGEKVKTVKSSDADQNPAAQKVTQEAAPASDAATEAAATEAEAPEDECFSFTYKDVKIPVNAPAADILEALGEPKSYTEEASCAFQGLDKTYYFGSFYLQTYPADDQDFIYSMWFVDDSIATEEGLCIGMPQAEVEKILGADAFDGTNSYSVTRGQSTLLVLIEDGAVSSVQYVSTVAN